MARDSRPHHALRDVAPQHIGKVEAHLYPFDTSFPPGDRQYLRSVEFLRADVAGSGLRVRVVDESYIDKAKERGWLLTDIGQTSPALWSNANELNIEMSLEPIKSLKIQLTFNRTDSRTNQVQFMYADMPLSRSGSYTKTHWALATALRGSKADDGYSSEAFNNFLRYIPVVRQRVESQYRGTRSPHDRVHD